MKKLGLKNLLILSVVLLVGLSVSISNFVLFLQDKKVLTEHIIKENSDYVHRQGAIVETFINEKVAGIHGLAAPYKDKELKGSPQQIIALTEIYARALNTGSAVISFNDGNAYWNQTNVRWPNHHYYRDVRKQTWYQEAMQVSGVTISKPYQEPSDSVYWLTIIERIKNGAISADLKLEFLNTVVQRATDHSGTSAVILDSDANVIATSSTALELGRKATSYQWFNEMAQKMVNQESLIQNYVLNDQEKIYFSHRLYVGDKHWYFCIGLNKAVVFSKLQHTVNIAIITAAISVVISMILAFIILQILYRPILALKETILGLSSGDGDLMQRLDVTSDDDLGQIAQGVNNVIDKIKELLTHKDKTSSSVLTNSEKELSTLGDTFTQRWNDAFEQYRSRITKEEELREELKLDTLTRLPTRSYFEILLSDAIKDVYSENRRLLLVTLNLDNYELITENFTYNQVQRAILELADWLKKILPTDVILSRTTQTEFSVIFKTDSDEPNHFDSLVVELATKLDNMETRDMMFHCKLGASHLSYTDEKPTVSGLFYQVNNALYSIVDNTDKNYAFYYKEQDIEKEQRQALLSDFRSALRKEHELELYFQPQINIVTQQISGAEALIRWNHPEKGFLTPDKFVHILDDDLQLNIQFGEWVIASVMEKLSKRTDSLTISINITPSHLQRMDFFERLKYLLHAYPQSVAQRLNIELTETGSISNLARVKESMCKCSELGVRFSLDDFGTGYSTLSQLRTLSATELKIDRSFVQNLENSKDDRKMIKTMLMLAKSFDIGVVVEGVENREQENILKELEASVIQGYYYSKPIPYKAFNQWLETRHI